MKSCIVFLMLCALSGCAQHKGNFPPVSGDPQPVNSPAMIQELTQNA